jgi:hypothetical protein
VGSFSIWHLLSALIPLCIMGVPIYLAVSRARAEKGVMTPGFKGWLFIFAMTLWVSLLRALIMLLMIVLQPTDTQFPLLGQVDLALQLAVTASAAWAVLLMVKRSAGFMRAFTVAVGLSILALPVSVVVSVLLMNTVYGVPLTMMQAIGHVSFEIAQWIGGLVSIGAWVWYARTSRRVAMTFTQHR